MGLGTALGLAIFCISVVMGLFSGLTPQTIVLRGAAGFTAFFLLGLALQYGWRFLSKESPKPDLPSVDFTMGPEFPELK